MDKRTLLIIAALLLPVVMVVVLAQLGEPSAPDANTALRQEQAPPKPAAEAKPLKGRSRAPNTLPAIEDKPNAAVTEQRAARSPFPRPPRNLAEARARTKQRLADLEKMTEEEWQAEMAQKQRDQERWMRMPPERKMQMLEKQQQKQQLRDAEKMVNPEAALPPLKEQAPAQ